jgi:phosphonate transport system substrate-binding protein
MNNTEHLSINRRRLMSGLAVAVATPWSTTSLEATASTTASAPKILRLSVVPQLTSVEMSRAWDPIVEALTAAGIPCELKLHSSIEKFEQEFRQALADIVFLNPYHMVMANRAHRYEPLLHDARPLEGVLVVLADGPVREVARLKDHRISFPAPNAFAASLYIRAILERKYNLDFETHYAMNHKNAVRQVLTGDSAAAGVVRTTLEKEPPEVLQRLRVLYTTPALPPHPIAVHPRIPSSMRAKIVDTLLALASDPAQRSLMAAIQMPQPVRAVYARDYEPLNRLHIEKFVVVE